VTFPKGCVPWNKGKTDVFTKETLAKMSESAKGRIPWNKGNRGLCSKETLAKMSRIHKGKTLSPEHKAALHASNSGETHWLYNNPMPESMKQNISKALTGRHLSKEHRKTLSDLHKNKKSHDPETCQCIGCRKKRGEYVASYWKGKTLSMDHRIKLAYAHCESIDGIIKVSKKFSGCNGGIILPQKVIDDRNKKLFNEDGELIMPIDIATREAMYFDATGTIILPQKIIDGLHNRKLEERFLLSRKVIAENRKHIKVNRRLMATADPQEP